MPPRVRSKLTIFAWSLAALYGLDRLLKLWAVNRFLRRPAPPAPQRWPSVSLLQPITRGASDLPGALACRAALLYDGPLQHILICDAGDSHSLALCTAWRAAHPDLEIDILTLPGLISTKVQKLQRALPGATGAVLAFVDDDILLRPTALTGLVRHLQEPRAGSAFGIAVYTNWRTVPGSLLSAFVNANALLSYLPLTYLAEPFTITGHFYAIRREVFDAIGGLDGMEGRFDDDHELARRIHLHALTNVQTSVLYDVDNDLATFNDYANQMRRWFVIPRQTMAPYLTPRQGAVSLLGSLGNLLPPALALLALSRRTPLTPLLWSLAIFAAIYTWCERRYLRRHTPLRRAPLVLLSVLIAPLQALAGLLGDSTFTWRSQSIRLYKGGRFEVIDATRHFSHDSIRSQISCQNSRIRARKIRFGSPPAVR